MKKRLIYSSVLTLILCLSLITGATYALFTSESKNDITISSGKVEVTTTIEDLLLSSPKLINEDGTVVNNEYIDSETTFVNGGFATLNNNELTITNMTPGDKVSFNIVIHNNSTVSVKYRTLLSVTENKGLFDALVVTKDGNPFVYTEQSEWENLAVGSTDIVIPFEVFLPTSVTNGFQDTRVKLTFSVNATQGNTNTSDNNDEGVLYLYNVSDMVMFQKSVANGNTYLGKTIVLMNDIDLAGINWTPIGQSQGGQFLGTFDGQNHIISNLNVDNSHEERTGAGLFGWVGGYNGTTATGHPVIKNIKLEKANIIGNKWTGGIAGYVENTDAGYTIENCHVSGSIIAGTRTGGIVGFVSSSKTNVYVKNCSVSNCTIAGIDSTGEIAGYSYENAVFEGNTFENITNEADTLYIASADGLFNFAKEVNEGNESYKGKKVVLVADIDLNNALWTPIGQTGATQFLGTFDGNNHTISNLYIDTKNILDNKNYASGLFGWVEGAEIIKNVKIAGATIHSTMKSGAIAGYIGLGTIIDNCHVSNINIIAKHYHTDACGDKIGSLIGYANADNIIKNSSAKDCAISAGRDAGKLVGACPTSVVDAATCNTTNVVITQNTDPVCPDFRQDRFDSTDLIGRVI